MRPHPPPTPTPHPAAPVAAAVVCAVLETEVAAFARACPNLRRIETLPQGLHNEPCRLRDRVQAAIDRLEEDAAIETIVLAYGLCSRGTEGLTARRCTLVLPRAHDCITLLLGSRRRYDDYVALSPGTYWYSPGWNRHHTPPGPERYQKLLDEYTRRYGEDNARFLMEAEQGWFDAYERAAYVHLTVGATDADKRYTRACAQWLGWEYDEQTGDPRLLMALLGGPWDEERFLVVRPGETIAMTGDDRIVRAVPAPRLEEVAR